MAGLLAKAKLILIARQRFPWRPTGVHMHMCAVHQRYAPGGLC